MRQVESSTGGTPSDAELILQVRSGDRDAFGVLYERHAGAARALARQYVSPADADDVVADAFSKLFEMLRRGAGPDAGFRTYLYTVVRHRSFDVSRGASRTRPTTDDEIESVLGRVASVDDPALAGFERSVVSRAYFDLPERWREVLWYVLVDDLKPAQVAPVLGLSPNGVSALLYRAKEALRAGYLQQHLTHAPSDTCRTVNPLLGGYVRDSLSKRETAKIKDHLATCGTCNALVLELHDVAHGMKTVIAPLVLGAGGLALVGAGAPFGGLAVAAKAGAGAAAGAPATAVTVASTSTFSGAVSSAVSAAAGAIASATGGSVAAGAIAAAAVGMVASLQLAAPDETDPMTDTVIASSEGRELPGTEEVNGEPVRPTDLEPGANTTYLDVDYADASAPLAAREAGSLSFTVTNTGNTGATGTQLKITLPTGLAVAKPDGPFGTGVGGRLVPGSVGTADAPESEAAPASSPASTPNPGSDAASGTSDATGTGSGASDGEMRALPSASPTEPADRGSMPTRGPAACNLTEQSNVLLCTLGELAPGAERQVDLPVHANAGGDYPVGALIWADGVAPVPVDLPARTVAPFGQELSAQTDDVSLASPGVAALPVRVVSTGDRTVSAGWAVGVTLPDGVKPASAQPELSCVAGEMPNAWRCAPLAGTDAAAVPLDPGATVDLALNITTAVTPSEQAAVLGAANVRPVLQGNARSASATLVATSAWAGADAGVGAVSASCLAKGGTDQADAVVTGKYTNTTQRPVRVALEAAGGRAGSGKDLAPGEAIELTVHDGLRVPAGQAVFVLATEVDGQPYETRVVAGDHGRAGDCYTPSWTTETSARTYNAGGTVGVEGTLTNTSDESMTAVMSVPVGNKNIESVSIPVSPGGTVTLSVNTERQSLPEGDVTFHLSRDGVDKDGDLPERRPMPAANPTAHHDGAVIAPAVGPTPLAGGACEFNAELDHSVQTFAVMADNTKSTLPVKFHIADTTRTVPAGESMAIEFPVVWGTDTATLTAAGTPLTEVPVEFDSCAELTWPTEQVSVDTAATCVDDTRVQLTAMVANGTGHDWTGVMVRESSGEMGEKKAVPAGVPTTLELTRYTSLSSGGNVTVRLTRALEGAEHTVERSFSVPGKICLAGEECELEPAADATPSTTDGGQWPWTVSGTCRDEETPEQEVSSGDGTSDAPVDASAGDASDDSVETVAGVTEAGHDVGPLVQTLVYRGYDN